jgi:hypothetical protein
MVGKATFSTQGYRYSDDNVTIKIVIFKGTQGTYVVTLKYLTNSGTCKGTGQSIGMITIGSNGYGQFSFTGAAISGTHEFGLVLQLPHTQTSYASTLAKLTVG